MQTATLHSTEARTQSAQQYTPLAQETRANLLVLDKQRLLTATGRIQHIAEVANA